jgi:hypothetical protein
MVAASVEAPRQADKGTLAAAWIGTRGQPGHRHGAMAANSAGAIRPQAPAICQFASRLDFFVRCNICTKVLCDSLMDSAKNPSTDLISQPWSCPFCCWVFFASVYQKRVHPRNKRIRLSSPNRSLETR